MLSRKASTILKLNDTHLNIIHEPEKKPQGKNILNCIIMKVGYQRRQNETGSDCFQECGDYLRDGMRDDMLLQWQRCDFIKMSLRKKMISALGQ